MECQCAGCYPEREARKKFRKEMDDYRNLPPRVLSDEERKRALRALYEMAGMEFPPKQSEVAP